jgi:FtsP/CotA-like multicopper oxidase with cupredoxin domain
MKSRNIRRREFTAALGAAALAPGCAMRIQGDTTEMELVAQPARALLRSAQQPQVAVWSYGGTVPGPEIRVLQGSRLRVHLLNKLTDETTVHWHGLRVPNAMDGVPHLTQPPVKPGERFTYEFSLPDAGTYWYHSHHRSAEQVERGLYGVFIVQEPDPIRVDRELTWVLDDWRLTREGQISETFGHPHDMSHEGRIGNVVTVNGKAPQTLSVRRGERLRIRLINAANARIFGLKFDGHQPQVIALDGQPVKPHEPAGGQIVLAPGMRADLVLDAMGEPGKRYAIGDVFYPRAAYDLLEMDYSPSTLRDRPLANRIELPANPLPQPDLASAQTHEIRFQGGMMGQLHAATLNGQTMNMMSLMRAGKAWAVNGVVSAGHTMHAGHSEHAALTLRRGRTYIFAFVNETRWHHPIHLHGHSFNVIRRNGQPTRHQEWRDTVLMAPDERVDVAFVADNPGDWMMHCHILEHQDGGMMSVFRVA